MKWPWSKKSSPKRNAGATQSKRAYAGAMFGRLVEDWVASSASMDSEIRSSLRALRNRSRQLTRDNDYAKSIKRAILNNVVGVGFGLQVKFKMERGEGINAKLSREAEKHWRRWCRKDSCTTTRKHTFVKAQRLALGSYFDNGEAIIRFIQKPFGRSKVPLALEFIDPDLLDDDFNGIAPNSSNEVRMGIEFDSWGGPLAYYFLPKHPGDYNFAASPYARSEARTRIPAEEIIHLFDPETARQSRGVPHLSSTIMRLHNMAGLEEAEVVSQRATASLMGFIESTEGELRGDDVENGERVTDFAPGIFKYLAPGEKVNIPNLNRQPGVVEPMLKVLLRGCAAGTGVSYEGVSGDFGNGSYSSMRASILSERDNYRVMQMWLEENFHQLIFEKWLDLAVLSGVLKIPKYELDPESYAESVRWMPRGWSWVDPTKEIAAFKDGVRCGFTTNTEVVAESGGDFGELVETRKGEVELMKKAGLKFETDPGSDPEKTFGNPGSPGGDEKPPAGKKPKDASEESDDSTDGVGASEKVFSPRVLRGFGH